MRKSDGKEGGQSRGGVVVVVVVGTVVVVAATVAPVVEDPAASGAEAFPGSDDPSARVDAGGGVISSLWLVGASGGLPSEIAVLEQDSSTTRPKATGRRGRREAAMGLADDRSLNLWPASRSPPHRVRRLVDLASRPDGDSRSSSPALWRPLSVMIP